MRGAAVNPRRAGSNPAWPAFWALMFFLAGTRVAGADEISTGDPPPVFSPWDYTASLRLGVGHKDNLLWSDLNQHHSAFETVEVEAGIFRLPIDGPEVTVLFLGEDTRYFQSAAVEKEQSFLALAQIKTALSANLQGLFKAEYSFQDQVVDVSDSVQNLHALKVRGHGLTLGGGARRGLAGEWWLEAEAAGLRQYYRGLVDDYWSHNTRLTLGRGSRLREEAALSYEFQRQLFDAETRQVTALGVPIPDSELRLVKHRLRLDWRRRWDEPQHWRTRTHLELLWNTDHGSGYFDYRKVQLGQELQFVARSWEARLRCRYRHYFYPVQPVGAADLRRRDRGEFTAGLRLERSLARSVKLFADGQYERQQSNRSSETYHGSTVSLGLIWEK